MLRSSRHVLRATAMASAVVLFLPTAAMAASPGAPGIGDSYFPTYGNGGYDATHYDVAVTLAADEVTLSGTTTMTATATQDLSRFDLDFLLHTTKVTVNGKTAKFTHDVAHELVVTPASAIKSGDKMTVVVTYSDKPGDITDGGKHPVYATEPGMLILGEPESAAWWMATNDHPRDKATYDIAITVQKGLSGLTSGRLVSTDKTDAATDTWKWAINQPSTGYQVPLAIGDYDVTESTVGGLPTVTAIASGLGAAGEAAAADFARLGEVEKFLTSQFGAYPFDAHGNVVPNASVGSALECQTRPVYSRQFWGSGHSNIGVVVHEQAHQWWGDNVAVHNWHNIWLNEGFAQWSQWRFDEHKGGASADETLMAYYNSVPPDNPFWLMKIGDPGADSLFAPPVYTRGAMTVQALRNRLGEKDTLALFHQWQIKHTHSNANIAKFRKLAEHISGKNLKSFFRAWLFTSEKPADTKKNGLGEHVADLAGTTPADIPGWDQLQQTTAMIAAAEGASHAGR